MSKIISINQVLTRAVLFIAGLCVFASCSVSNFQKRKYTHGYYFSSASHRHKVEEKTLTAKKANYLKEKESSAQTSVKTESTVVENAIAVHPGNTPENVSHLPAGPFSKFESARSSNQVSPYNQPGKVIKNAVKKQQAYNSTKKGPIGLLFKIILVLLLIGLAAMIIIILTLAH